MNKITSIIISKEKIYIWDSEKSVFVEVCVWNNKSLLEQLKLIKQNYNLSKIQLFLSDELSFVLSFQIEKTEDSKVRHEKIAEKIAERIPEYFDNIVWDYKVVDLEDSSLIQVAAVEKSLIVQLQKDFEAANFDVLVIEPLSCAIAKTIDSSKTAKLVIATGVIENIIFLTYKSSVFIVDLLNTEGEVNETKKFIEYIIQKYPENRPDAVIIDDAKKVFSSDLKDYLKGLNLELQAKSDLLKGISENLGEKETRKSQERLDLIESDALLKPSAISRLTIMIKSLLSKYHLNKNSKFMKGLFFGLVILLLLISSLMLFLYFRSKSLKTNSPQTQNNQTVEVAPVQEIESTPVPETVVNNESSVTQENLIDDLKLSDFSGYKLQILNGSGIKGEADKLRALLGDLKFTEITIGNADKTDYVDTLVSYKTMKLLNNTELLDTRMITYKMEHTETLLKEDNPYDIVIIIGKARLDEKGNSIGEIKKTETSPTDSSGIAPLQ